MVIEKIMIRLIKMIGQRGEWPFSRAFTTDITGNLLDKTSS